MTQRRAIRIGTASVLLRPRHLVVAVIALLALGAVTVFSLGTGDFTLSPDRVLAGIAGSGTRQENVIIGSVRLPRVLSGIAVGAALALSGAIVQTLARNALASPDLLGVTAGASAGAVAVITLSGSGIAVSGLLREVGVPLAAGAGSVVAAAAVALLLRRTGYGGVRPILIGLGVSIFFGGLTSWMLLAAEITDAAKANLWLAGSLNGRSWPEFVVVFSALVLSCLILVRLASYLPALSLGIDTARGLGVPIRPVVGSLLAIALLLAAVSASAAGPIGFVALVAPHLARLLSGSTRAPLGLSAMLGALLLTGTDLVARMALAPIQLPVGSVVALVGAPFLVWLLISSRRKAYV